MKPWPDVRLSPTLTARRCACRGWIVAPEGAAEATAVKVREHQLEEPHKEWDREAWVEANTTTVDVPIAKLRKVG